MKISPLFDDLVSALQCFPGVGPKSAQRMALYALERDRQGAQRLSMMLSDALEQIGRCDCCHVHTEHSTCQICIDQRRDRSLLCVVESVSDMLALEQAGSYTGLYFVLSGHLSPLDGIGPEDIGLPLLQVRLTDDEIKEVILANGTTVEGEATAHYVMSMVDLLRQEGRQLKTSRIAYGVPMGGELELVDSYTLGHAINGRKLLSNEFT